MSWKLAATAAFGLEPVVGRELRAMGYEPQVDTGVVRFVGGPADVVRANLWLRCADRVLIELGTFPAATFDQLFEGTKTLPWEEWLAQDVVFPVEGWCVRSTLMSVSDCQSIVKKAVVERLKGHYNINWFPETGPTYRIRFGILKDEVTLYLDTSGHGLHKRGYRPLNAMAPLHETLGAGLVYLSRWFSGARPVMVEGQPIQRPPQPLWDPCCGSGTIPIEAALIAKNAAPGLQARFEAEGWRQVEATLWQQQRQEAKAGEKAFAEPVIFATDIDEAAVALTRKHAGNAGVAHMLHIQRQALRDLRTDLPKGVLITNPPYGQRMGDQQEAEALYRQIAQKAKEIPGWSTHIITPHQQFERIYGKRADKRTKVYNGGMACQYYSYYVK